MVSLVPNLIVKFVILCRSPHNTIYVFKIASDTSSTLQETLASLITNPASDTSSTLQETLASLITNLGELPPNQLASLAGLLSKNLSNGNGTYTVFELHQG